MNILRTKFAQTLHQNISTYENAVGNVTVRMSWTRSVSKATDWLWVRLLRVQLLQEQELFPHCHVQMDSVAHPASKWMGKMS